MLLIACQPKLNQPADSADNLNLNSLLTLEIGENNLFLQDFIFHPADIDSVTSSSELVDIKLSKDRLNALLNVDPSMEQFVDIKIWVKGIAYSVPCRKSDKIDYVFSYDPLALSFKQPKRVQIAGQMNDWTPSRTPDLQFKDNHLFEVKLSLSPGTYLYQLLIDGEQNHDASNPDKVDNGFGKYNSILQIAGKNDSFPVLLTENYSQQSILLSLQNNANSVFAYWQNRLLPDNFIKMKSGEIMIDIPADAKDVERSFIRVWASNKWGVSNDILIPLQNGEVLTDAKQITRNDRQAQIMYFLLMDRFKNGNTANDHPLNRPDVNPKVDFWGGDLAGLQQEIEAGYFEKLGFNTLWVSPLS